MKLVIKGKSYQLPVFLPDATHAAIKGTDTVDLVAANVRGLVTNTYHLLVDEIVPAVKNAGGIKSFMNFNGLVVTDSGGFQAMSIVRRNKVNGTLTDDGVKFKNPKNGKTILLTPESCIEAQFDLGSDIIMVLDDCTHPDEQSVEQEISIYRTVAWAKRCKDRYNELAAKLSKDSRPLIFGIIQGGNSKEYRKKCAEELIKIGFDGYAYGGWPLDKSGLLHEILSYTASLMPNNTPKYAMGVGKPEDIKACAKMGYNIFDCVIPTRDARHGRLYLFDAVKVSTLNLGNTVFLNDFGPIDTKCGCYTCKNYSRSYLRYLFKIGETLFYKLATIHNIYVFNQVIEAI